VFGLVFGIAVVTTIVRSLTLMETSVVVTVFVEAGMYETETAVLTP
jgi:hypothetical protein